MRMRRRRRRRGGEGRFVLDDVEVEAIEQAELDRRIRVSVCSKSNEIQ